MSYKLQPQGKHKTEKQTLNKKFGYKHSIFDRKTLTYSQGNKRLKR